MQLTPRYGADPLIVLHGPPGEIAEPAIRQGRRLVEVLGSLSDEQWAHPSRCAGWSIRDVVVHLDSALTFWAFSIEQGLRGRPTQFLAEFDPVATPAQIVDAAGEITAPEVFDRFAASSAAFAELLSSLDEGDWSKLAEAPPGHVSITALAHHSLWDAWVHERDIVLPLGGEAVVEPDEVAAALRYVLALGPAFAISQGSTHTGVLAIDATDPDVQVVAEIGRRVDVRTGTAAAADLCLSGNAVDLLEALSLRRPLDPPVPDNRAWLVGGLATTFDAGRREEPSK